ncbi:MAG: phage holin family protein [Thainema sp.]
MEKKRLTSGVILLAIGGGLMAFFGLLFHVISILFLQTLTHSWIQALLIVASFDFLMGSVFLLAATRRLRGPYMVQTQARVARTAATLMKNGPNGTENRNDYGQI